MEVNPLWALAVAVVPAVLIFVPQFYTARNTRIKDQSSERSTVDELELKEREQLTTAQLAMFDRQQREIIAKDTEIGMLRRDRDFNYRAFRHWETLAHACRHMIYNHRQAINGLRVRLGMDEIEWAEIPLPEYFDRPGVP